MTPTQQSRLLAAARFFCNYIAEALRQHETRCLPLDSRLSHGLTAELCLTGFDTSGLRAWVRERGRGALQFGLPPAHPRDAKRLGTLFLGDEEMTSSAWSQRLEEALRQGGEVSFRWPQSICLARDGVGVRAAIASKGPQGEGQIDLTWVWREVEVPGGIEPP